MQNQHRYYPATYSRRKTLFACLSDIFFKDMGSQVSRDTGNRVVFVQEDCSWVRRN